MEQKNKREKSKRQKRKRKKRKARKSEMNTNLIGEHIIKNTIKIYSKKLITQGRIFVNLQSNFIRMFMNDLEA